MNYPSSRPSILILSTWYGILRPAIALTLQGFDVTVSMSLSKIAISDIDLILVIDRSKKKPKPTFVNSLKSVRDIPIIWVGNVNPLKDKSIKFMSSVHFYMLPGFSWFSAVSEANKILGR